MQFTRRNVLIAGGGAVLLLGILAFANRPARVVTRAVTALAAADTGAFVATIELANAQAAAPVLGEPGTVEVKLTGVFSRGAQANQRDRLQADVVITAKSDSVTLAVEGEVRFVDDQAYVLIKKAPPGALNPLKGVWLELPRGQASQPATTTVSEDLFTDVKRAGTEKLGEETVVKYTAIARETAVVRMMDGIAELLGTRLTDAQVAEIMVSVQRAGQVPTEVWISRWGTTLRRLAATVDVPGGNAMRFVLTMTDINLKTNIMVPENAVPINEAMGALNAAARNGQ